MSKSLLKQSVEWVDSNSALEACCSRWENSSLLALDTEFIRTNTYYPIAGLIQVNDGVRTYLIDPLDIDDWFPLIEILDDESRIIAMHACSEDLEVLQMELGTVPAKILDTQIAAAFLGLESSQGYSKLISSELGVDIPKAETRSDWLQRPLSLPQKTYAALDVEYLYQLAQSFIDKLTEVERFDWVLEEGLRVYKNFKQLQDINNSYLRIKSAWKLKPQKLAVLIALAKWRENYAQQENIPRNRIVKEQALFELALKTPDHASKLRTIDGVPDRVIRKQGTVILSIIHEQSKLDEASLPDALPPAFSKDERALLQDLKASIKDISERIGIAPELILRKKESEALLRLQLAGDWDAIEQFFKGWRQEVVAEDIIRTLRAL